MSAQKDRWDSFLVFLLFCASSMPRSGSVGLQQEPSPQHYFSGLEAGKASLAFFTPSVSPGAQPFLEQIESSAEALQDYGISVVKVNCPKEDVSRYCGKENALRKAFLFRGNRLIREFPTDALFDVNSIVANVLFALLFNEVKYVETLADLENIENALKGKSNMVFAYVPATGTVEHRAVMEAAFVYGTIHQFVLTTEAALLKATSHDDPDVSSAWLLFCHCQRATDPAQPCRRTALGQPLTLLNIHRHLKLMGAPLLTEVAEDPEKVSTVHLQLGLPLVFILSQKETYEADRRTAEFVAWQLLGKAGVALLSRDLVDLNVLHRSNIALKTPDEGMPIQYLVLEDTDEVITLVENKNKVKQMQEAEQQEEEEEEDEDEKENNNQDIQDDQVMEAVSRDKKRELPLEQVLVLTEENFHSSLSEAAPTVVLFYASWEAVSLAVLRSYSEVAALLKGTPGVLLCQVNCWDWPGLCSQENVTQFPSMKIYKEGQQPVPYNGMWGTEELSSFILLMRDTARKVEEKYFSNLATHVEFLPVEWRSKLTLDGDTVDSITPDKVRGLRDMLNSSAMDIMYYTSPLYRDELVKGLQQELNRLYSLFCSRNPEFEEKGGKVSIVSHSLGCVITYDIMTGWNPVRLYEQLLQKEEEEELEERWMSYEEQRLLEELYVTKQRLREIEERLHELKASTISKPPVLKFKVENFFCMGSPLAVFLALRGIRPGTSGSQDHILPRTICNRLLNIFHPTDPVAYRLEPLILKHYSNISPVQIHWYNTANPLPYEHMKPSFLNPTKEATSAPDSESASAAPSPTTSPVMVRRHYGESITNIGKASILGAASIGKGLGGMLFSRFGRSSATPQTMETGKDGPEGDEKKATTVGTPPLPHSSSGFLEPTVELEHRIDFELREGLVESRYWSAVTSHTAYWSSLDIALFLLTFMYKQDQEETDKSNLDTL